MKVMKIITNVLLIPSVILWLVCGAIFPLSHAVSIWITDVSDFEIIILNVMVYSSLVATPMGLFNYLSNVDYKTLIKKLKEGKSPDKKPCESCKKK
jgi:hypothetical protein